MTDGKVTAKMSRCSLACPSSVCAAKPDEVVTKDYKCGNMILICIPIAFKLHK